jgi:putative oxidoreductase
MTWPSGTAPARGYRHGACPLHEAASRGREACKQRQIRRPGFTNGSRVGIATGAVGQITQAMQAEQIVATGRTMKYLVLIGRILYSAIFAMSAPGHFEPATIAYAASKGVPFPSILVPASGIIAFLGALSIILGYKARYGCWLLVIFLVPVTLAMHNFWAISDPMAARIQQIMFMKNVSMLGTALLIAHFGSGPLSLDKTP